VTKSPGYLDNLLKNLKTIRERAGISRSELEERMILGPGWVERFESGATAPSIDMLLAILHETGSKFTDLLEGLPSHPDATELERLIFAEPSGNDLTINFRYAEHDATYMLLKATIDEFESVIKIMRDKLAMLATDENNSTAIKTDAVASTFLKAVAIWPHANPSDLWWFLVYRGFCDPYNHPAQYARLDLAQSWKRTGGWALEEVLVRHYGPFLHERGIDLLISDAATKQGIVAAIDVGERIEADKIDVIVLESGSGKFLGVVNVKASFAERRTDDVPMSLALAKKGYASPLWTMDCKSMPSAIPRNKGELGAASGKTRSAKRRDIEDEGYFTGCFSYNRNTQPTAGLKSAEQSIHVCDFSNPDDAFSQFILSRLPNP